MGSDLSYEDMSNRNIDKYSYNRLDDALIDGKTCYVIEAIPASESRSSYSKHISESDTVVWNGPMGVFESSFFEDGTKSLANHIATCTQNGLISIMGGGDTASALRKFNLENKMSHLSTGGGASI